MNKDISDPLIVVQSDPAIICLLIPNNFCKGESVIDST